MQSSYFIMLLFLCIRNENKIVMKWKRRKNIFKVNDEKQLKDLKNTKRLVSLSSLNHFPINFEFL